MLDAKTGSVVWHLCGKRTDTLLIHFVFRFSELIIMHNGNSRLTTRVQLIVCHFNSVLTRQ